PIYVFGAGYEYGIAPDLSLLVEANYQLMPQKYIAGAFRDGSYINIKAGIKYEFETDNRRKRR
ncbi:MAG: hypothetical protein V1752_07750, partial [Candidatus Firestonebacteria bacterium]